MIKSKILRCLFFLTIISQVAAQNNTATATPEIKVEGDTVYYSGPINAVGVGKIINILENKKYKTLRINSRGGEIISAIDFGEAVFRHGLDVVVTDLCNSSCANYIFPAGKNKKIEIGGFVMWHGDARQRSFMQSQEFLEKKAFSDIESMTDAELQRLAYSQKSISRQDEFYAMIGINGQIARIGQEINDPVHLWALSVQKMALFNITQISAPTDYAEVKYCTKWLSKHYAKPAATCLDLTFDEINALRKIDFKK